MKSIILLSFLLSTMLFAEEKKKEKTYTEKEFRAEVLKVTKKKLEKLKRTSIVELTKELVDKEEDLAVREKQLLQKEELLSLGNKELVTKIKVFTDKKKKFIGCVGENEKKIDARVLQLVEVISQMKPDQAAQILSIQEKSISVKILSKLTSKRASKIFNVMDKEVSARLQKDFLNMKQ